MRFLLLMAHDESFSADGELISDIFAWIEAQTRAGVRITGAPLTPPDQARTVVVREGITQISGQPFTPGPLHTAAFEVIECSDLDAALEPEPPAVLSFVAVGGLLTLLVAHTLFAGPVYRVTSATAAQLFAPEPYISTVLGTPGKLYPPADKGTDPDAKEE